MVQGLLAGAFAAVHRLSTAVGFYERFDTGLTAIRRIASSPHDFIGLHTVATQYYLRDDAKIEPLIARWHAHALLVSPPSAAYMTRHHLEMMTSFVARPELHRKVLAQPTMRGGPFIDSSSVDDVRRLLEQTRATRSDLLDLASNLDELASLLREAKGFSLDPLYGELGPCLQGRVELTYESSGHARYRLFEPLFYAAFPSRSHQELALSLVQNDDRPFLMSTPRLDGSGDVFLRLPFESEGARALLRARQQAVSSTQVDEWYESQDPDRRQSRAAFEALFTQTPPAAPKPCEPGIQYIGHACVLISTGRENLLFDPLVSYRVPGQPPRFTMRDLPETIDCAVITHAHFDHYVLETLLQIRDRTRTLVVPRSNAGDIFDPALDRMSRQFGFDAVALQPFETLERDSFRLQTFPFLGEHGNLDIHTKLGYRVEAGDRSIVFVADSDNVDPRLYEHVRELYGPTDTLFIGLECTGAPVSWAYGPLLGGSLSRDMDQSRRTRGCDAARGLEIIDTLGCRRVYVYAMALEPWMEMFGGATCAEGSRQAKEIQILLSECAARGIEARLLDGSCALTW